MVPNMWERSHWTMVSGGCLSPRGWDYILSCWRCASHNTVVMFCWFYPSLCPREWEYDSSWQAAFVWMMGATRYQASSSFHDAPFAALVDAMKPPAMKVPKPLHPNVDNCKSGHSGCWGLSFGEQNQHRLRYSLSCTGRCLWIYGRSGWKGSEMGRDAPNMVHVIGKMYEYMGKSIVFFFSSISSLAVVFTVSGMYTCSPSAWCWLNLCNGGRDENVAIQGINSYI